jgi:pimeloyl-ACP methyl ester carboxylesterase
LLASPLGPLIARLTSFRAFAANMRRLWGSRPLPTAELRELWAAVSRERGTRVMPGLIGYMAERRQHRARWVGALEQLDAPLSVIIGLDDPISGAHVAAGCRELFPQAKVIDLPGVGHYPQLEAPERVLAALPWQLVQAA